MKKWLVIFWLFLVLQANLFALPMGNPFEATFFSQDEWDYDTICQENIFNRFGFDSWNLRLGYYGDFIFDSHMKVDSDEGSSSIQNSAIWTNAGYFALNFCNWFDLFATLGGTRVMIETPAESFGLASNPLIKVETNTHFSYSLGLRAALYEYQCFGIGLEAQYFFSKPHLDFVAQEDADTFYFADDARMKYEAWQIGIGACYRLNISCCQSALIPYGGIRWAQSRIKMDGFTAPNLGVTLRNLENERDWGYAIGMTILGCNRIGINVEARFVDEKALNVIAQYRF